MKKVFVRITVALLIVIIYFVGQYFWLTKTDKLPYQNLTYTGSGSCYVIFNVENNDSIYTVAIPNEIANMFVKRKSEFLYAFYPLYMREVIAHKLAISVDDSLFEEMSSFLVDPSIVTEVEKRDIRHDTTLFIKDNRLRYDMNRSEFNAIVYVFMRNGSNCCVDDYSGVTSVSMKGLP